MIPKQMKCVAITSIGGPDVLKVEKRPIPSISDYEILIKVMAAGVNRPDVMQRRGLYNPPKGASDLPGLEVSGLVVALGKKVSQFKIGDKVCALTHGGGYSEYCKTNNNHALLMPKNLTYEESASIPETFFTVWANIFDRGKLKKNDTILIHGGSSGIGTAAIQMAKSIGAKVFITAGSKKKCIACSELGADETINYNKEDFKNKTLELTNGKGINIILDMIGASYLKKNIESLADNGRLCIIALQSGFKCDINLMDILLNRITITASTLRPRSDKEKARIAKNVYKRFWPLLENKTIKPCIYKVFKMSNASKAHKLMETSKHIGKIILKN